jgi:hypothetical protein
MPSAHKPPFPSRVAEPACRPCVRQAEQFAPTDMRSFGKAGGEFKPADGASAGVALPAAKQAPHASSGAAPLPVGWIEQNDPATGQMFYANTNTSATQWERPC